ncbi:MAG: hypothetical protein JW941_12205 [Candidatus Coatesbacteria bacterium]|nr:hypothetical protein [Candidatus Coatesbacteria bacterium]
MIGREILTTFLSVLLMLIAIGYVSAADYYVCVGGAGSQDGSSETNAFAKIQDGVDACVSGYYDTVHVAEGTYKSVSNGGDQTYPINIDNKTGITLEGNGKRYYGPWLQGDGQARIIVIKNSNNITIRNFKVSDGHSNGDGGGIYVEGTDNAENLDIYMFDLEVTDNTCDGNGGGMAWEYSCGMIWNCCIWENSAPNREDGLGGGGGLYLMWPAESENNEGCYVRDCCIFWNQAANKGGAILMTGYPSIVEIQNNLIRQNCVGRVGAAAGIESGCARAYIKNNTVVDNYHCDDNRPTYGKDAAGGTPTQNVYGIFGCEVDGYWLRMIHNIVYFNGSPSFRDINVFKNTNFVMYSDVQMDGSGVKYPDYITSPTDGYSSGNTNCNFDPMFEGEQQDRPCNSTFYFLSENSRCVDAGIPAYTDEWGQGHCEFVNTTSGYGKDFKYSVHISAVEDKDFWCDDGSNQDDENRIDLGYHYDWAGMNYIELSTFTVKADSDKAVISWETGTEIDNAGFLVYRCDSEASGCSKISDFISASASVASGAAYSFTDTNVKPGATYYYYLVDIDTSGNWTAHGPVETTIPVSISMITGPKLSEVAHR